MILHRDSDWLVVDKPCGMATHAGKPGELGAAEWPAAVPAGELPPLSLLDDPPEQKAGWSKDSLEAMSRGTRLPKGCGVWCGRASATSFFPS